MGLIAEKHIITFTTQSFQEDEAFRKFMIVYDLQTVNVRSCTKNDCITEYSFDLDANVVGTHTFTAFKDYFMPLTYIPEGKISDYLITEVLTEVKNLIKQGRKVDSLVYLSSELRKIGKKTGLKQLKDFIDSL